MAKSAQGLKAKHPRGSPGRTGGKPAGFTFGVGLPQSKTWKNCLMIMQKTKGQTTRLSAPPKKFDLNSQLHFLSRKRAMISLKHLRNRKDVPPSRMSVSRRKRTNDPR
ncbi:hypothetical protein FMN50_10325 [Rhodobacterales bacterium]|nr:hypothetical protein FMN50_10325 [Rhodobacterales bacterium]